MLSDDERTALEAALVKVKYDKGLSTFLRQLAIRAAVGSVRPGLTSAQVVTAAAAAAGNQTVGEWIRNIALAAVGASDLLEQLQLAREEFDRVTSWQS